MYIFILTWRLHWRDKTLVSHKICWDLLCVDELIQQKSFWWLFQFSTGFIPWLFQIYQAKYGLSKFKCSDCRAFLSRWLLKHPRFPQLLSWLEWYIKLYSDLLWPRWFNHPSCRRFDWVIGWIQYCSWGQYDADVCKYLGRKRILLAFWGSSK